MLLKPIFQTTETLEMFLKFPPGLVQHGTGGG